MAHLLEVTDLVTEFESDSGHIAAIDRVSFSVDAGEILGIVGESGCGKSVTSLSVMRLLGPGGKISSGSVRFDGQELTEMSDRELDRIRGSELTMIFQDALASLNPVFTVGNQILESIHAHTPLRGAAARQRAVEMLRKVGLPEPEKIMKKYPHTLSGGMRQRVVIAMALCCGARLVIADEPTTALDVTIQAQIMQLLKSLQRETGMGVILITHDIGLIAQMADRVLVMYAGQIVESASVEELFASPAHPYTRALMASVPDIRDGKSRVLQSIPGHVPEDYGSMTGCRFCSRCSEAEAACAEAQEMRPVCGRAEHTVRCRHAGGEKRQEEAKA